MQKDTVIIIGGPTASGKTALSIELAKRINGQIISADSMQIYKDMNIGTAKPDKKEQDGIKHYMLDFLSPEVRYSVADYKKDAKKAIKEIINNGKVPIIVGGTGLYIDSLIYEIEYPQIETDLEYRDELEKIVEKEGLENLYNKAKDIDPESMQKISPNDKKRILRVLEIYKETGRKKSDIDKESRKEAEYNYVLFAITMPRDLLYNRINLRVDKMIEAGLINEVEKLLEKYKKFPTSMQGLGYKEIVEYLNNEITKEEAIDKIKQESRRYAKRQLTWFRKNKETIWIDGTLDLDINVNNILEEVKKRETRKKD